ncbi:MAG: hypothetical protein NT069_07115, partial [Planctomycetota bacterium]|nr:hypothetical protein [Planctomycetota bacterium]
MNSFERFASGSFKLALAAAVGAGAWWLCTSPAATSKTEKPPPSATVAKVIKEDSLNTVTLTEEAAKRLGVSVAVAETKRLRRTRVYGGEVVVPPGRSIQVAAPLGGLLKTAGPTLPAMGEPVVKGQVLYRLQPLLTPEARTTLSASLVEAEGLVKNAET